MVRFRAFDSGSESEDSSSISSVRPRQRRLDRPTKPRASSAESRTSSIGSEISEQESEQESNVDSIIEEEPQATTDIEEEEVMDESGPWPEQIDLVPQRVNVMQSAFFLDGEAGATKIKETNGLFKHRLPLDAQVAAGEIPMRTSFEQPRSQPPPRKYIRVASSSSVSARFEGVYLDAGLSMGHSFRVGWGPTNRLVSVGSADFASSHGANTSMVKIIVPKADIQKTPDLLGYLLSCTYIEPSSGGDVAPLAVPNGELTFGSFASLFAPNDKSHSASVFRLGHALFDPLDLHLGQNVSADIRNRVYTLRRADELSAWLAHAVAPSVDQDIYAQASTNASKIAFLLLTGNQVDKAVDVLAAGGFIRLATLISQIAGDLEFRADAREQLEIWRDEKIDLHMSESVRKLYALAAGEAEFLRGSSDKEDIDITKGLGWLRVFGLQLWYSSSAGTPLRDTLERYEKLVGENTGKVAGPTPWYTKGSGSSVTDGLFSLIKLSLSDSITLESSLDPRSYSPNPQDYKMPWFLYVILSRCLRVRDFTDRQLLDVMDEDSDVTQDSHSYSQIASLLTVNFSSQLEEVGLIQQAAFILLFLEDDVGRKRAIDALLARSAPFLDEWNVAGLHGSLKIPLEWIDEAKAVYELYSGNIYRAYELYVQAKSYHAAHELAIAYLAPEAALQDDLDLLSSLFTCLDESSIDDYSIGGELFVNYVRIVSRVTELRESADANTILDAAEADELERLGLRIPKLMGMLSDANRSKQGSPEKRGAALSHMLSKLLDCLDQPTRIELEPGLVDEGVRLRHIHSSAYSAFMKTIETIG